MDTHRGEPEMTIQRRDYSLKNIQLVLSIEIHPREKSQVRHLVTSDKIKRMEQKARRYTGNFTESYGRP